MSNDNKWLNIYDSEIDGEQALCCDTGLDSRSFARARLAQFLTESGCIVNPDNSIIPWKARGVCEAVNPSHTQGMQTMHIFGPAFAGTRLDQLLNDTARSDAALAAVVSWIDARLALEKQENLPRVPLWPCAALIASTEQSSAALFQSAALFHSAMLFQSAALFHNAMLFLPENIVRRCMQSEDEQALLRGAAQYVHPDLEGAAASAFTAAAMLYRVCAGSGAFTALREEVLHQDMREGNFLPIRLAAPGLDPEIAKLIQEALMSQGKTGGVPSATKNAAAPSLLSRLRECIGAVSPELEISAFFHGLSQQEQAKLADEKEKFLRRKKIQVNTKRFVIRNTTIIAGIAAALLIVFLAAAGIAKSRAAAPSTAGMDSLTVVRSYYMAINSLDHQFLEACTARGAGKTDINMTSNLFVITRVRQAYEYTPFQFMSPDESLEAEMPPPDIPIYGISGLRITHVSGSEDSDAVHYSAVYTLWIPMSDDESNEPNVYNYTDELRLERIKGNWRICEIIRN